MWFKNLQLYRLPEHWDMDAARMEERLAATPLQPCGGLDLRTQGWVSPNDGEALVFALERQLLIALGEEQKLMPASVINQYAQDRAAEISEREARRVGRKELREIKERVVDELLPRAFARRRALRAWIDPVRGWLAVDCAARTRAEEVITQLGKSLEDFPARLYATQLSPAVAMTAWLAEGEAPAGFTLDRDLELRAPGDERATVRYVRHALDGEEIQEHIAAGKQAVRVGMTWNDRISFTLTEDAQIKRLAFLDILKEQNESSAEGAEEQFALDFALMAGELAKMLDDLTDALGGLALQG
jgi:recombination associated protein RdgC